MFREGQSVTINVLSTDTTTKTGRIPDVDSGFLIELKLVIPNVTNTVTFTFYVLDEQGDERYSLTGIGRNTKSILSPFVYCKRGYSFGILPSGATGTTIDVDMYPVYEA